MLSKYDTVDLGTFFDAGLLLLPVLRSPLQWTKAQSNWRPPDAKDRSELVLSTVFRLFNFESDQPCYLLARAKK